MRRARAGLPLVLASLFLPFVSGCDGRPRAAMAKAEASKHAGGTEVAVVDLSVGAPESPVSGMFGLPSHRGTFDELVAAIDAIETNTDVKGVFVRFGAAPFGLSRATEVGELLHRVSQKVPVYCHAEGYSNASLYLAARGCTRISLSPAGDVEAVGLAAQVVYMRKLLEDTLGLSVNMLQVGKFKGAEEPLTRDGPSEEARASLEQTLSRIRDEWLAKIREGRHLTDDSVVEDGPFGPEAAREKKLIDAVEYSDEARGQLHDAVGTSHDEVKFGPGVTDDDDEFANILRGLAGDVGPEGPIAIVRATGSITMGGSSGFGSGQGITLHGLGRVLDKIEHDDDVKAVVLRIDSPGGSALASDLLWHRLMRIRAVKPIVVSIGEMAASGGYYLASTGNVIVAEPTSIVGSIGVVGGKVGFGKALERIGVHSETFPAKRGDAKAAARAGYESPFVAWDEPTKQRVYESMKSVYALFLSRVAEGRGQKVEEIALSAEGRIFGGTEGKERKLVDQLGGLEQAIEIARGLAHLPPDAKAVPVGIHGGLLDSIEGGGGDNDSHVRALMAALGFGAFASRAQRDINVFAQSFSPLGDGELNVVALPFSFDVH